MPGTSLTEFAKQYAADGYPRDPRLGSRVYVTDSSTSVLVWSEGDFLVEHYLMYPGVTVPEHSHPFDSVTIFWSGQLLGRRAGEVGNWLFDQHSGHIGGVVKAGDWHSFITGERGAVIYVVSQWTDPADKESATLRYIGEPMGPKHAAQLVGTRGQTC